MSGQDFIDLLIITAWTYGNGYITAWLIAPLGLDPHRTGSLFAFVGIVVGMLGVFVRQRSGRFPLGATFIVWPLPFLCTSLAAAWWVIDKIQQWLGVI